LKDFQKYFENRPIDWCDCFVSHQSQLFFLGGFLYLIKLGLVFFAGGFAVTHFVDADAGQPTTTALNRLTPHQHADTHQYDQDQKQPEGE